MLFSMFMVTSYAQQKENRIVTQDIDNFWQAYDQLKTTNDSLTQLELLQKLYITPGTPGLKAMMEVKGYTPADYVKAIRKYPQYWNGLRPLSLRAKALKDEFEPPIAKFKKLYPELRPAKIYFTVGALRSSGTTQGNMVLIGSELAMGDETLPVTEFSAGMQRFLKQYFKSDPFKHIVLLNVHEYVHTQQSGYGYNLLSQSIYEGTCDFIAELVTGKLPVLPYVTYGPQHETALKTQFKAEMEQESWSNWLYNSAQGERVGDLGYYMGYAICKAYYKQAKNKKEAIKTMIELNYKSPEAVHAFVKTSGYFN